MISTTLSFSAMELLKHTHYFVTKKKKSLVQQFIYFGSSENVTSPNYASNIWLKVPRPSSPQLGAFDCHPRASGCPLDKCITTPLDRICEVQLNL